MEMEAVEDPGCLLQNPVGLVQRQGCPGDRWEWTLGLQLVGGGDEVGEVARGAWCCGGSSACWMPRGGLPGRSPEALDRTPLNGGQGWWWGTGCMPGNFMARQQSDH